MNLKEFEQFKKDSMTKSLADFAVGREYQKFSLLLGAIKKHLISTISTTKCVYKVGIVRQ